MDHNHPDECSECAAERRHEALISVLLGIDQTLQTLLLERRSDSSISTVVEKLEAIRRR